MREILFRGKRADGGGWIEGNLFIPDREDTPTEICIGTNIVRITYEVVPETVGQFTGVTDKNGIKIFEGDIVKDEISRAVYKVFYCVDSAMFIKEGVLRSDLGNTHRLEVIDNIHDNRLEYFEYEK